MGTLVSMSRLQTFLSSAPLSQRVCLLVSLLAVVLLIGFTGVQEMRYSSRPLQIAQLAGREVGTEKMADIFIRMDELALRQHYLFVWTLNGVIFLSVLLLLKALGVATKK